MKKKIPVGVVDFKKIIEENYYYIDKTFLIKELIESGSQVTLIPRPRRFGKTINLSMLKYFFEKTTVDKSYLFKDLNISNYSKEYSKHFCKYPIIHITFKDIKNTSLEDCFENLKSLIADEFSRHKYLLEGDFLDEFEKKFFINILDLTGSKSLYENSLKKLSFYLTKYFNTKVIILIDEYDTPVQSGYNNGYYDEIIEFMRNFLSGALKDNDLNLERAVLTGILRVAKESVFSGLNNLKVCSILNEEYSTYFGLLENEVEDMLKYYEIHFNIEEVKKWYNGYVFGKTTIYNPWSIINYVDNYKEGLRPHWINTSSNDLIKELISHGDSEVKEDIEELIRFNTISKIIDDAVVFSNLDKNSNTLWSFFLMCGYLKFVSKTLLEEGDILCQLQIPNMEVRYLFKQTITGWFEESLQSKDVTMMLNALISGDIKLFNVIFKKFVMSSFSYFDTSGKDSEKVYHAFVLGLLVNLNGTHEVKSNRESGYGRYDVMLIPRDLTKKGIILEFKKVDEDDGEGLEDACSAALMQIEEKKYEQELHGRGITDIVKVAIAFDGKKVLCKS